jgi:thiamine pyrophosphate-dependent acetolactate synthase large subunit-like protein
VELGTIIVAGGGVVRDGVVHELRELVDKTQTGVFNSWAAKGLFQWDNPAHLGTMGLQRDDFVLGQLADADEVLMLGVDDAEIPRALLTELGVNWRDIATSDVSALQVRVRENVIERPALYGALAAVCQPMYADDSLPMNPGRAAADLAAWLPDNAFATADANICGFWLGRTFPTRHLGSVQLPTKITPGFAVTAALTAARIGQTAVVVTDHIDDVTESVLERARSIGSSLVVEVWSQDAQPLSSDKRIMQLEAAVRAGGVATLTLGIDLSRRKDLEEVAGPICVWDL